MSSVVLTGDTSGAGTLTVPAVAGTFTATLGSATGTHYPFTAGTAVASTSGTSIDFTSIPSWVKRITVLFSSISTNGTNAYQVQLGSGSFTTSGYTSQGTTVTGGGIGALTSTTGLLVGAGVGAAAIHRGSMTIQNITGNTWVGSAIGSGLDGSGNIASRQGGGDIALGGTLDRVRITTVGSTDTFDAGTVNIFYE